MMPRNTHCNPGSRLRIQPGVAPQPSSAKGHGAPLGRFPMPLENFIQDLRYGVRMLRRDPLFAGAAVITLGLGLGATLAVFNVVNGVLLRPLPYRDPERINIVWFAVRGDDGNVWKLPLSSGSYSDIERVGKECRSRWSPYH